MAIKLSLVRRRLAAAVEGISGKNLKQSKLPFDAFGRTPNSIAHKAYAIGIQGSSADQNRQKPSVGSLIRTDFIVKMSYRIRPLDQLADIDASLDLENDIVIALCDRTNTTLYNDIHISFSSLQRELTDSGEYMISDIGFELLSYLPLQ